VRCGRSLVWTYMTGRWLRVYHDIEKGEEWARLKSSPRRVAWW
jgi:hypothetical protein